MVAVDLNLFFGAMVAEFVVFLVVVVVAVVEVVVVVAVAAEVEMAAEVVVVVVVVVVVIEAAVVAVVGVCTGVRRHTLYPNVVVDLHPTYKEEEGPKDQDPIL